MNGINKVVLVGRMGQDPEMRVGKTGFPWCTLSVATNRHKKVEEEWVEETDWHRIKAFGRTAELVVDRTAKGSLVAIEGNLIYETWKDANTGENRRRAVVHCEKVTFLSPSPRSGKPGLVEVEREVQAAA